MSSKDKKFITGQFLETLGGRNVPEWLKNQPWNLMGMPNQEFHQALHGLGEMNFAERLWYGTPNWVAAGMASTAGREANWVFNADSGGPH